MHSIAARKATASTISSALAIGDGTTAAEEELAIAAHTRASRAPGNAARLVADRAAGRTRNAPSASTTAIAATMTNEPRHRPILANTPPASGPTRMATLHMPESSEITRAHAASGKVDRTST